MPAGRARDVEDEAVRLALGEAGATAHGLDVAGAALGRAGHDHAARARGVEPLGEDVDVAQELQIAGAVRRDQAAPLVPIHRAPHNRGGAGAVRVDRLGDRLRVRDRGGEHDGRPVAGVLEHGGDDARHGAGILHDGGELVLGEVAGTGRHLGQIHVVDHHAARGDRREPAIADRLAEVVAVGDALECVAERRAVRAIGRRGEAEDAGRREVGEDRLVAGGRRVLALVDHDQREGVRGPRGEPGPTQRRHGRDHHRCVPAALIGLLDAGTDVDRRELADGLVDQLLTVGEEQRAAALRDHQAEDLGGDHRLAEARREHDQG